MTKENQNSAEKWVELKELLLQEEESRIQTLEGRVLHPEDFAQSMAEVLPDAIQNTEDKSRLSQKLYPVVEESIYKSVQKNPDSLADAIYPVISPAIRKAINEALKKVTESVNKSVNEGLTARSMKWRVQALFTKHSYGDIVLKNSLLYQVKEIYLIHKETGLLITHMSQKTGNNPDGDMISGMLTAIKDFVTDSFDTTESLERIQVGDLTVLLDQGPHATLAAVVEGDPDSKLKDGLTSALEHIHQEFGRELDQFDGDTEALADTQLALAPCLVTEVESKGSGKRSEIKKKSGPSGKMKSILFFLGFILIIFIAWLVYLRIEQGKINKRLKDNGYEIYMHQRHGRKYKPIIKQSFITELQSTKTVPEILDEYQNKNAINTERISEDDIFSKNLKKAILHIQTKRKLEVDYMVEYSPVLKIYQLLDHDTANIEITYSHQTLSLSGQLPNARISELKNLLPLIADDTKIDFTHLVADEYIEILGIKKQIDQILLFFKPESNQLIADQFDKVLELNDYLIKANALCNALDQPWQLEVTGAAPVDSNGSSRSEIENQRALFVVDQLIDKELDWLYVTWVASNKRKKKKLENLVKEPADLHNVSFELTPVRR